MKYAVTNAFNAFEYDWMTGEDKKKCKTLPQYLAYIMELEVISCPKKQHIGGILKHFSYFQALTCFFLKSGWLAHVKKHF